MLPAAAGIALSPFPVIAIVLVLVSPNGRTKGVVLTGRLVGVAVVAHGSGAPRPRTDPGFRGVPNCGRLAAGGRRCCAPDRSRLEMADTSSHGAGRTSGVDVPTRRPVGSRCCAYPCVARRGQSRRTSCSRSPPARRSPNWWTTASTRSLRLRCSSRCHRSPWWANVAAAVRRAPSRCCVGGSTRLTVRTPPRSRWSCWSPWADDLGDGIAGLTG